MADMIINAALIDWILALVALEGVAVLGWRALKGSGPQPLAFLSNLVTGAFLLVALRGAVSGASGGWIAACIFAANAVALSRKTLSSAMPCISSSEPPFRRGIRATSSVAA